MRFQLVTIISAILVTGALAAPHQAAGLSPREWTPNCSPGAYTCGRPGGAPQQILVCDPSGHWATNNICGANCECANDSNPYCTC